MKRANLERRTSYTDKPMDSHDKDAADLDHTAMVNLNGRRDFQSPSVKQYRRLSACRVVLGKYAVFPRNVSKLRGGGPMVLTNDSFKIPREVLVPYQPDRYLNYARDPQSVAIPYEVGSRRRRLDVALA